MKSSISYFRHWIAAALLPGALLALLDGCATGQPRPEITHQRGWIGGEYKLAQPPRFWESSEVVSAFPSALLPAHKTGLLVTTLGPNTPARLAGLREGDLILEINRQPVTGLSDFHRTIDRAAPGNLLPVEAWRDGQVVEYNVPVGRETFRYYGTFCLGLHFSDPDLSCQDGFSLIVVEYRNSTQDRTELGSVESTYRRKSGSGKYEPTEQDWNAWLVIMGASKGKTILA